MMVQRARSRHYAAHTDPGSALMDGGLTVPLAATATIP